LETISKFFSGILVSSLFSGPTANNIYEDTLFPAKVNKKQRNFRPVRDESPYGIILDSYLLYDDNISRINLSRITIHNYENCTFRGDGNHWEGVCP
jgi:hypothetical protein